MISWKTLVSTDASVTFLPMTRVFTPPSGISGRRERFSGISPRPVRVSVPESASHFHLKPLPRLPDSVEAAEAVSAAGKAAGTAFRLMDASSRAETKIFMLFSY